MLDIAINPLIIFVGIYGDYCQYGAYIMIVKNCIKCKKCGDIIESESRHDFKYCSCKRVAVDGGHDYLRRCFIDGQDDYEELSIIEPDK